MSDGRRPDPAELLARVKREEARTGNVPGAAGVARGRFKIFFGMAPGVGKTYAMLAAAQRLAREGVDVCVGIVETHGRSETEAMTLGLDVLPRRAVAYRGAEGAASPVMLQEFDLDSALQRRPAVLLLDELAHTNAPGSRHEKRWQDAQTCLRAGINVFSTLNVQHIESLNDVVAQITGVKVRETIPDSVLEEADEVELVDLAPDALIERLRAGRVYVPEAARHAMESFFKKGNLTALRELALRRTAELVDTQLRDAQHGEGVRAVWPAAERILVAVSPSPMAPKLVRAARRMAGVMRAQLLVAYVETRGTATQPQSDQIRVLETLRLAESLGAQTITLTPASDRSAAQELIAFARSRNVSRLVVGKTGVSRRREGLALLFGGAGGFVDEVIRASGEIDVYVIQGDSDGTPAPRAPVLSTAAISRSARPSGYLGATAVIAFASVLSWAIYAPPDLSAESMVLLAGVVATALRFGRGPAILATMLAVLGCNFFLTEPRFSLAVNDPSHFLTFLVMLAVGLTVGTLTSRVRDQREQARERERRTASLYALTRELAAARTLMEVASVSARHAQDTFQSDVIIAAPTPDPDAAPLDVLASAGSPDWLDEPQHGTPSRANERAVARWALDNSKPAGLGTQSLPAAAGRFVPLIASQSKVGVLGLRPLDRDALLRVDQVLLLDTFAHQIALAIERVALIEGQQRARVETESERLRSALLSSVSHDLRTPLATIAGAASTLRESDQSLDDATRRELVDSIVSEAERLNELIANLVFATRLESGVELNREWTTIEEIVGSGLARFRDRLAIRPLRIVLPDDLPMVRVDNAMLPQVVANLVENALEYTPRDTPVSISAWTTDTHVVVKVSDEGRGLAEGEAARVFERFYRGRSAQGSGPPTSRRGMGLGLTICQGIIKAHEGRIWAEPNSPRGVSFLFSLPIERPQPGLIGEAKS